ncbi:MAG: replicative DNA helicase [Planctomycetes bacterium]|jgi:replicative DNA helicase|nr:replicative DNA helicase [Planctomycetota bacterium]
MTDEALLQHIPPQNVKAEIALLGSLLTQPDTVGDVIQKLKPGHFYSPENQIIYRAMLSLYDSHRPVDLITLPEELSREDIGDQAAILEKLTAMMEAVATASSADYYANIVHDKAVARQVIIACGEVLKEAYAPGGDARKLVESAERRLFAISEDRMAGEAAPVAEVIEDTFKIIDDLQSGTITGYPTGFADLDEQIGGLHPSELIIVAGRPSMGKTTFSLNIAGHVCIDSGRPAVLFSLEMAKEQIVLNMLCSRAKVNSHKVRRGFVDDAELAKLTRAAGDIQQSSFFIDDTPGLSIMELRAKCRRLRARHNIELVLVDYIQLMEGTDRTIAAGRQQEITEISRGLKTIARELNIPVIALSQLSRATEAREGHKPRMSDLRESGSIEQDADVVALLYREDYYYPEKRPNETDIIIAKQRNGPTGTIKLTFQKDIMRFQNFTQAP